MKRTKKLMAIATMSCMLLATSFSSNSVFAENTSSSIRLYGADRYHTAIAVAQANWTTSDYAVIARGDDFADALCAGPLAKSYNAPILLTQSSKLDPDVITSLKNLKVKTVFIVGGTGAVSNNVQNQITALNIKVDRFYGSDRFGTSANVASAVKAKLGSTTKVAIATGLDFPDALSISPIASNLGFPILLTNTNSLPSEVSKFISANSISQSYVVGGTGVVSDTVKNKLPNPIRLGGLDRFGTNIAILNQFDGVLNYNNIYVTTADEFADALSGSAAAAKTASPMILVSKSLSDAVGNFIYPKLMGNTKIIALGGTAVVPQTIIDQLISRISSPTLKSITLKDTADNLSVNALINEPASNSNIGTIRFNIPSSMKKINTGSAVLSENLSSASIVSQTLNKTVYNIKADDNFANIIFSAMTSAGYNPNDGVLTSNVQTLLNGSVLTLTDNSGSVKKYTIIVTIN